MIAFLLMCLLQVLNLSPAHDPAHHPALATGPAAEPSFDVQASLAETPFRRFGNGTIVVQVNVAENLGAAYGWDREPSDARPAYMRPLITLDVPPSIELLGAPPEKLVQPADYAMFFLDYPFGRHMPLSEVEIPFRWIHRPAVDETVGINITAFRGTGSEARFVRRRLELALSPGAQAKAGDARNTRWGRGGLLAVGDRLPGVELPTLGGGDMPLSELLEEGELLLFSYRAYW